ncbi:serine/threonine-protein kinase, partial [Roseisolibacter sp. H3M3-2]|uniref:serine/threonine-protein kinase n=1 Tax=Roseisolibacter sp. H3M3-2 TaxID=3031323 RepID=UPI0023DBACB7
MPTTSTEASDRLRAALAGRYAIHRELGRGGMAAVYLADDLKHHRTVALKVMHPGLAPAMGAERFAREVMVAARLQHPHVVTVYDSGESAGRCWYTMPYVAGETLRQRLDRDGWLSVAESVRIAREVARGLDHAHRRDIVHRDVKPENVLLGEDGVAMLADFGLARAVNAAPDSTLGRGALTAPGFYVGTPRYMAPEQGTGEFPVDARADVYALGCVLYEMLTGEPPHPGEQLESIFAARLGGPAPSVRALRRDVPDPVEAALARALERVPADRWATALSFAQAMDGQTVDGWTARTATPPAPAAAAPAAESA